MPRSLRIPYRIYSSDESEYEQERQYYGEECPDHPNGPSVGKDQMKIFCDLCALFRKKARRDTEKQLLLEERIKRKPGNKNQDHGEERYEGEQGHKAERASFRKAPVFGEPFGCTLQYNHNPMEELFFHTTLLISAELNANEVARIQLTLNCLVVI